MAVSRRSQKDVDKFKAKFVGGLTMKQTFIVGAGVILAAGVYYVCSNMLKMKLTDIIPFIIVAIAPFAFFAFANPYGMSATEFVKTWYENNMLSPKNRPYSSFDGIDYIEVKAKREAMNNKNKKGKTAQKPYKLKRDKKNPYYL